MTHFQESYTPRQALSLILSAKFSSDELFDLMFSAGLEGDEICSNRNSRSAIANDLVSYLGRRGAIGDILPVIDNKRPELLEYTNEIRQKLGQEAVKVPEPRPMPDMPPKPESPAQEAVQLLQEAMVKSTEVQQLILRAKALLSYA